MKPIARIVRELTWNPKNRVFGFGYPLNTIVLVTTLIEMAAAIYVTWIFHLSLKFFLEKKEEHQ